MSEKGASSAHRSAGAVATQRRANARPATPQAGARARGVLVLACVAASVTGTTLQVQGAPQLAQAPAPVQQVAAAAAPLPAPMAAAPAIAAVPATAAIATVAAPAAPATQVVAQLPTATESAAAPEQAPQASPAIGDVQAGPKYYAQLRSRLRWLPVNVGERKLATPDAGSRLLLAQSAAALAGLHEVGLDFRDVYGVINAETTWVPRTGMGKNGVASYGLAQFEPATARAVGLRNPNDPVEAVHAAAVLLKEAATWSQRRVGAMGLSPQMQAVKLREGVSIYYNLSTRARNGWNGANTHTLPVETRRHIRNVQVGAQQAEMLQARLGQGEAPALVQASFTLPAAAAEPARRTGTQQPARRPATTLASASSRKAASTPAARPVVVADRGGRKTWVLPQGTISWSKQDS